MRRLSSPFIVLPGELIVRFSSCLVTLYVIGDFWGLGKEEAPPKDRGNLQKDPLNLEDHSCAWPVAGTTQVSSYVTAVSSLLEHIRR